MAKKKNKTRKRMDRAGAGPTVASLFAADFAGEVVGNVIGALLASGVQNYLGGVGGVGVGRQHNGNGRGPGPAEDVAARLLEALAERGPMSIADLVAATGAGLSPVLGALQTAREFRLVELVGEAEGDDCVVQLTRNGSKTVGVIQKGGVRREAARRLGSEEVTS